METNRHPFDILFDEYCHATYLLQRSLKKSDPTLSKKYADCQLVTNIHDVNATIEKVAQLLKSPQGIEFMMRCADDKNLPDCPSLHTFQLLKKEYGSDTLASLNIFVDEGRVNHQPCNGVALYIGNTIASAFCTAPTLYECVCLYGSEFNFVTSKHSIVHCYCDRLSKKNNLSL